MPITDAQQRFIAARAATLDERLMAIPKEEDPCDECSADASALLLWNRAYSPNDTAAFARRLSWDGLDPDRARKALTTDPSTLYDEPPPWTRWLSSFMEEASAFARQLDLQPSFIEASYFDPENRPPFLELYVPILHAAMNDLVRNHPDAYREVSSTARQSLERQLLREIGNVSELALFERFCGFPRCDEPSDGRQLYRAFVSRMLGGEMTSMFENRPLLARHLVRLAETWVDAVGEFLERLRSDRQALATTFSSGEELGRLIWVETGLSDRHGGGRRVLALGFESGLRLVYKPRRVGIEQAYNRLLAWTSECGLEPAPKALKVLARNGYGWVEYVDQAELPDRDAVARYYRKAGGLICLAYVLRGRDLHMENLIASSDGPVLIDTEMLIQPVTARGETGIEPIPHEKPGAVGWASCLETGLLSLLQPDQAGRVYDIGGLRGKGGILSPVEKREWRGSGTDTMHFVETDDYVPPQKNEVRLDGSVQMPEAFVDDIVDGFRETYRFLLAHRDELLSHDGPMSWFQGTETRVVFRTSQQYAVLLHLLAHPKYQRDGLRQGFMMEALNRVFHREIERPLLWPLVADERHSLEKLDIPRFTISTEDTVLRSERGDSVEGYFTRSGLSAVRDLTQSLSDSHLEEQMEVIRDSLASSVDSRFQTPLMPPEATKEGFESRDLTAAFREYSAWVGRELLTHAFRGGGGGPRWTVPTRLRRREREEPFAPLSLYEGCAGVGLFMAALAAVTHDGTWRAAAVSTVEPIEQLLDRPEAHETFRAPPLGACDGIGSILYSLTWMSRLLEDSSITELAIRLARHVSADRIATDARLDVSGGAAGAILGLLTLYEETQDTGALDRAVRSGNHLIASQVRTPDGGSAWGEHLLTGFAHGAAGIAYALTRLFRHTGERELLEAADRAYRYERSWYSPAKGNWPIVRSSGDGLAEQRTYMTAWCHGAPGAALARTLTLDVLRDEQILQEIDAATRTTAHLARNRSDHLCCGNLGRSDVLLTLGTRLKRPELIDLAKAVAVQVTGRARAKGHFLLPSTSFVYPVFTPGFFRGLSGIGYQLLRTAAASRLPSVLSFEAEMPPAETDERKPT